MKARKKFAENFGAARRAIGLTQQHAAETLAALVCVPLDRMLTELRERVAEIATANMRAGTVR